MLKTAFMVERRQQKRSWTGRILGSTAQKVELSELVTSAMTAQEAAHKEKPSLSVENTDKIFFQI